MRGEAHQNEAPAPESCLSAPLHLLLLSLVCCCCCLPDEALPFLVLSGVPADPKELLPFIFVLDAGDDDDGPDATSTSGLYHPESSLSQTSTTPRETTTGSVFAEDKGDGAGMERWIVNWSARIEDAVTGSEGARRFERKRRRVCGRVLLLLLLLVSGGRTSM